MSSAGNLQEIVPYHVVGNVQEICKFPVHFHLPDMCWKCHLSCKFPAHILLQEMPHFFLCFQQSAPPPFQTLDPPLTGTCSFFDAPFYSKGFFWGGLLITK